jgi:type I restriction enzyme S subunit
MVIAKGHKQTEVGIIPENWEVKELGEIGEVIIGLTYSPNDVSEYGTLVLRSSNIQNNKLAYENNVFVTMTLPERVFVQERDLLICVRNGSRNLIGKSALIDKSAVGSAFGAFMSIYRSEWNNYISKLFQSNILLKQIENNLGATINQITNKDLKSFKVPLPTKKSEQTAISTALSDMDALIAQTEKLIEKKKAIKQGIMQELLRPKEGWVSKKLGEIVERVTTGKLDANAMNPDGEFRFYTCAKEYYFIDDYAFDDEALLISGNGANVGYIHYYKGKFNAYQRTYVLTGFTIDVDYVKIFLDKYLSERIATEVSASNTPYIKMDTITEMDIMYPLNFSDQINISSVINNISEEIDMLESKLIKLKLQKQGMMQALLTGKIRLI